MTKYILVSGGVISGIGKGVIGVSNPLSCDVLFAESLRRLLLSLSSRFGECLKILNVIIESLLDWAFAQNDRLKGHSYQDRSLHEYRCWYYGSH